MRLARALSARREGAQPLERAVRLAPEDHDLVVLGVVRLHVDKPIHRNSFRLRLTQLPSTEADRRYTGASIDPCLASPQLTSARTRHVCSSPTSTTITSPKS